LVVQVLSDQTKRKEYDTWGQTSEQRSRATSEPGGFSGHAKQHRAWNFSSNVDPEELFRRIFGDTAFKPGADPFSDGYKDFSESIYGYGAAEEVILTSN